MFELIISIVILLAIIGIGIFHYTVKHNHPLYIWAESETDIPKNEKLTFINIVSVLGSTIEYHPDFERLHGDFLKWSEENMNDRDRQRIKADI